MKFWLGKSSYSVQSRERHVIARVLTQLLYRVTHSSCLTAPVLREVCQKRSQIIRNLCYLYLHCLLVLKSPIPGAPACGTSKSVAGGASHFCGRPGTLFSLHCRYCLCNEDLCFLRNFWIMEAALSGDASSIFKPLKVLLV